MSSSYGNKVWTGHHPQLRRQKTCIETGNIVNKSRDKRFSVLQRQLSVDATSVIVNTTKYSQNSTSSYDSNYNLKTTNETIWKNKNGENNFGKSIEQRSEQNLKMLASVKKRPQGTNNTKNEQELQERFKKALKDRGNRLNLNIFLSHSTNSQEHDNTGSDAEDSNESIIILTKDNSSSSKFDLQSKNKTSTAINKCNNDINNAICNNNNSMKNPDQTVLITTTNLPNNYSENDNNIAIEPTNSNDNVMNNQSSSVTKPPEHRRPPLVRAMSAPIRPIDTSETIKQIQVKRKLKKKKMQRDREDNLEENLLVEDQDSSGNSSYSINNNNNSPTNIITSNYNNYSTLTNEKNLFENNNKITTKNSSKKTNLMRPRSAAIPSDIVTLVSLLSSGGSDSEKEDTATKTEVITTRIRAPMLKKTGKSVSFQEHHESQIDLSAATTKDFATKLRRASVAPLAARLRINRPPTAPASSIYLNDYDLTNEDTPQIRNQNLTDNSDKIKDLEELTTPINNVITLKDEIEEIKIDYPENVKTLKEKECWRLFQKMLNRGITVSYETILRGMLTPTELRIIQREKEIEEAKQSEEVEELDTEKHQ